MKLTKVLLIFVFLSRMFQSFCQDKPLKWDTSFNHKSGWKHATGIVQTNGGNIFSIGYGKFPCSTGQSLSDNGILLCQDKDGNELWSKIIGGNSDDRLNSLVLDNEGNLLIGGVTSSSNGDLTGLGIRNFSDAWLIKVDTLGDILWQKTFDFSSGDDKINSISISEDGGIVFCGTSSPSYSSPNFLFGKTDIYGNLVWSKVLIGNLDDEANQIITDNNVIYIVGNTDSETGDLKKLYGYKEDIVILKVSSLGAILWEKVYGGKYEDFGTGITKTNDGHIVIASESYSCDGDIYSRNGCSYEFYHPKFFLFKLNSNDGSFIWKQDVYHDFSSLPRFVKTSDDGDIIVGGTEYNTLFVDKVNHLTGGIRMPEWYGGYTGIENFSPLKSTIGFDNEGGYLYAGAGGFIYPGEYFNTARIRPKVFPNIYDMAYCKGDSVNIVIKTIAENSKIKDKLIISIENGKVQIPLDTVNFSNNLKLKLPYEVDLNKWYNIRVSSLNQTTAQRKQRELIFGPAGEMSGHKLSGKDDPLPTFDLFVIGKPPFKIELNTNDTLTLFTSFTTEQIVSNPKVGTNLYSISSIKDQCGYEGFKKGTAIIEKTDYCTSLRPNIDYFSDSSGYVNDFLIRDKNEIVYQNLNSGFADFTYFQSKDTIQLKKNREYELSLKFNKNKGDVIIWIDYNGDKIFSNSEIVHMTIFSGHLNGYKKSIVNFKIPVDKPEVTTRLRVRFMKDISHEFFSCNYVEENEIEDYYVKIIDNEENAIFLNNTKSFLCISENIQIGSTNINNFLPDNQFKGLLRKVGQPNFEEIVLGSSLPLSFTVPSSLEFNSDYEFKIVSTNPAFESISKIFTLNKFPKLSMSGFSIIKKGESVPIKFIFESLPPFTFGHNYDSGFQLKTQNNEVIVNEYFLTSRTFIPSFVMNACGLGEVLGNQIVEVRDSIPVQYVSCFRLNNSFNDEIGTSEIINFGASFDNSTPFNENVSLKLIESEFDYFKLKSDNRVNGPYTLSFWFKNNKFQNTFQSEIIPVLNGFDSNGSHSVSFYIYDNKMYLNEMRIGEFLVEFNNNLEWHNIVYTREPNTIKLFIDGELKISYIDYSGNIIPSYWIFGKNNDKFFDGNFDDIKYFKGSVDLEIVYDIFQNRNLCTLSSLNCRENGILINVISGEFELNVKESLELLNLNKKSSRVNLNAMESIMFYPGFEVEKGGVFKAQISNCPN